MSLAVWEKETPKSRLPREKLISSNMNDRTAEFCTASDRRTTFSLTDYISPWTVLRELWSRFLLEEKWLPSLSFLATCCATLAVHSCCPLLLSSPPVHSLPFLPSIYLLLSRFFVFRKNTYASHVSPMLSHRVIYETHMPFFLSILVSPFDKICFKNTDELQWSNDVNDGKEMVTCLWWHCLTSCLLLHMKKEWNMLLKCMVRERWEGNHGRVKSWEEDEKLSWDKNWRAV